MYGKYTCDVVNGEYMENKTEQNINSRSVEYYKTTLEFLENRVEKAWEEFPIVQAVKARIALIRMSYRQMLCMGKIIH